MSNACKRKLEKPFYKIEDLKAAKKILMLVDGYRKLNIEDFAWADKEVKEGKMGVKFSKDWKEIREIMLKFAREAGSQRRLLNLAALQQILIQAGLVISAITTLLATLSMVAFLFHFEWARLVPEILSYALIPLAIGIVVMLAGPPLIARKISSELEKFFARKRDLVVKADPILKDAAQKIINGISEGIKNGDLKVKKRKAYELGLFNTDYDGIKIVKKPSFFRKYYIVLPEDA
ncbi:MAG: hypothetical protein QXR89_00430 [Candidatus Bathyarchaeia archaeon]